MKINQSRVKSFRRCRQEFDYKYNQHLIRRKIKRHFVFGNLGHEMWEEYANGGDPFEVLDRIDPSQMRVFQAEREEYGNIIEDIRCIMTEYFNYYKSNSLVLQRRNKRAAEHEFAVELTKDITFVGKIDGVGKTPNKLLWLVEHKTSKHDPPNEDHRWRNLQSAVYIRAIEMLGWWKVEGTCWDYILSKPPAVPKVLKSGELSQAQLSTLPSRLEAELKKLKLNPKDFAQMMDDAKENRKRYFQRIFSTISKPVIDSLFKDFLATATEIVSYGDDPNMITRNIDKHCSWCDYEPLCRATLKGLDVDFVKEREYNVEEPPEVETESAGEAIE
jgi:hypothetical protein